MRKLFFTIYQQVLRIYVSTFRIKKTKIIHEIGSSRKIGALLKQDGFDNVLIITDKVLKGLGLLDDMTKSLKEQGVKYALYDGVVPNPTVKNVEEAKKIYIENGCNAIIAFGGGSVIDCAKMTGVVALSGKSVKRYDKMIPMISKMAPLYAVPTTAGTGSEVTLSAVITDEDSHKKMAITDAKLAPDAAILDAGLLTGLPKSIVAATGIDALTHAIEAYIGNWKFKVTDEYAIKAVKQVFGYLECAYKDGDVEALHEMLLGALYGGYAFRTAGVGYVHAIAHRLGEMYGVPHGLANAMVLPHMLRHSFDDVYKKIADLSKKAGLADASKTDREITEDFVSKVSELNKALGIPEHVEQIEKSDIELMAKRAIAEANRTYPVPNVMSKKQIASFIASLRPIKTNGGEKEDTDMLKGKIEETVDKQYAYFNSGKTLDYKTRINNLKRLKAAIKAYEQEIMNALKADLFKHPFEAYGTEISIVYTEINHALSKLRRWMKPKRVGTPIVSFGGVSKIYKQPRGVVLIMSPWNYPLQLTLAPVVAAVAAGNAMVIKPSSYSPNVSAVIEQMISEHFEPEYMSVFQGNRDINAILLNQKFDYIFFTGSVKVGKIVMQQAAKTLTPITLELGGKSPCIVDKTADLVKTARRIVWGKSVNAGQTCIAPDYLLVHERVKDELVTEMMKAKEKFYGNRTIDSGDFGKIIRKQAFDGLVELLDGQKVLYGGNYDEDKLKIELTLLDNPALDSDVMQREIFGPILPVIPVADMDEAMKIISGYAKPLALYLFTKDKEVQKKFIRNVPFGGGCVNDTLMHIANSNLPFGGVGDSGIGSYHADKGFEAFTHLKSVIKQNFLFDVPIRYAPYKKKLGLLKKIIK